MQLSQAASLHEEFPSVTLVPFWKEVAAPVVSAIRHPKGTKGMLSPARNRDALSTFLPLDRPQVIVAVTVVDLLCPG